MLARLLILLPLVVLVQGCGVRIGLPDTPGAFIDAVRGEPFEVVDTLDPRNAMIYIYRPSSRWGKEEVQAPVFFIEGQQLFGLKSGAYSWLETNAGAYDFSARRPLAVLFVKTILQLPLEVEGGKVYYFRYSETQPVALEEIVDSPEQYLQAGPLQQVPEAFALRELKHLRLDEAGLYYAGSHYKEPQWAPFYSYPESAEAPEEAAR